MHAQIGRLDASGRPHRSGDEHLPTVAGGLDVCGSVDHRPEVVATALLGFTEVQTHADLQGWATSRPYSSLLRQAALTSEDLALFNALSTVNFEEILDRLETAETVCRQLGHNDAEVAVGPKACPLPKGQRRR